MSKKNNTSWGGVAKWYDSLLQMDGTYQQEVILPNLLRLLDIKKGEKVLDIACGQGFFTRAIAGKGSDVTGTDISPELIKFAKEKAGKNERYFVANAENFFQEMVRTNFVNDDKLNGQGFDKAIIVFFDHIYMIYIS
jgi:ubiquinone/menaquinone biosynthesis C-methylase UbiE